MQSLPTALFVYSTAESWKLPLPPPSTKTTGSWTAAPTLEVSAMPGLRIGSWVALLAFVSSSASYASVIGRSEAVFRQFYSLGPNGRVTIQNNYGDVSITGWDRDGL